MAASIGILISGAAALFSRDSITSMAASIGILINGAAALFSRDSITSTSITCKKFYF